MSQILLPQFLKCADEKKQVSEGHIECAHVYKISKYAKILQIISLMISVLVEAPPPAPGIHIIKEFGMFC